MIKTLFLTIATAIFVLAGEADQKLPASAQAVLDKATAEVAKNRLAYDKANEKPLGEAEKALKAEMDKATKATRLNDALAIQKALEGLRESVVASVDEKARQKGDLLGEARADLTKAIAGKWKYTDGSRSFVANVTDSQITLSDGNSGKIQTAEGKITISWSNGFVYVLNYDTKSGSFSGINDGRSVSLMR